MHQDDSAGGGCTIVQRLLERVFRVGGAAPVDDLVTADYVLRDDASPMPAVGAAGLAALATRYHRAYPELRLAIDDQAATADLVITHWRLTAVNAGKRVGVAPGPAVVTYRGRRHSRLAGARLSDESVHWDTLDLVAHGPLSSAAARDARGRCATPLARVDRDGIRDAGALLARAFADDPMFVHVLPEPHERAAFLSDYCAAVARYGYHIGEAHIAGSPGIGSSVWSSPDAGELTDEQVRIAGFSAATEHLPPEARGRLLGMTEHFAALRRRTVSGPHWYLLMVGVDPARQGHGAGSRLLAPVIARADGEGLPCYLETTQARNVGWYEAHGFEVCGTGTLPDAGPSYWAMLRPPRS